MHFFPFPSFFNIFHALPSSTGHKKRTTAQSISFHDDFEENFYPHQELEEDECASNSFTSPSQLIKLPNELLIGHIFSYLDLKVHIRGNLFII
jgi:hypothetical protein